jgi:preprotein translocase subunit SecY
MGSTAYNSYFASAFTFGGTSILIGVGVAQETFRTLEAKLTMRHYKGCLCFNGFDREKKR